MAASGAAGLGLQIVWTQRAALWLGHESAAVLAVVAAFFGGLAVGAFALGPHIARSDRPAQWYAAAEAAIGAWALALLALQEPAAEWLLRWTGAQPTPAWQWAVAFGGCFVLLLPATAAMGATLPAMERVVARAAAGGSRVGLIYAANTAGAVAGVLGAAFWLVPAFGLAMTAMACAALNLAGAFGAVIWLDDAVPPAAPARRTVSPATLRLAATGAFGIGYEVLVVREVAQVAENTVYTYALLLAVYLLGTAAGAAAWQRWIAPRGEAPAWRARLLVALAAACLGGTGALYGAETLKRGWLSLVGSGYLPALSAEAFVAALAFALPTALMGAVFCHLAREARDDGSDFGRALAINTLGGAVAPALFGLLLLPAAGAGGALCAVAAGYALLAGRGAAPWFVAGAAATVALAAPPIGFVDVPEGGRLVAQRESAAASVTLVETADGALELHIDNRDREGSSATRVADARQALLPLLLHPAPKRALFLGLGSGVTAHAAALDPALGVTAVELLPDVAALSPRIAQRAFGEAPLPPVQVVVADARRFVRTTDARYDLVVADNFHPARSGSGALYTVEHFEAVRERLAPGGLFCQWLPLHQLELPTLRSIVRAYLATFPDAVAVLATNSLQTPVLGLVAVAGGTRFDADAVRARLDRLRPTVDLAAFGLPDELSVLGSVVAGPRALQAWAAGTAANTDDRPIVAYDAPRGTYAPREAPRDRLLALLDTLDATPAEILAMRDDGATAQRLAAYWQARTRFLHAGRDVVPTADVERMLARVRDPLLAVLRISPDFAPAREPLRRMAAALAERDPAASRELQRQLELSSTPR